MATTIFYPWIIFLHVLSALTFFLAHSSATVMAFRLRRETNYDRICALLDYPVNIVGYVVPALILWLMVFKPF
jgi:hypothetical protein